jgi:DNA-binding beta-propeller fold protein YncE
MRVSAGDIEFDWLGDWAQLPAQDSVTDGWSHHGMAFSDEGQIVTFHPAKSLVVILTTEGELVRSFEIPVTEAHGLTLSTQGLTQSIWIADNGRKRDPGYNYDYVPDPLQSKVVRVSMAGLVEMELFEPAVPGLQGADFSATSVIAFDEHLGGNGDIWVADGYGKSLVHRYNATGEYLQTIDGSRGGGRFDCPHSLWIDTRPDSPELLVADRANGRVQAFDMEGGYIRTIGADYFDRPTVFSNYGENLLVGELNARVTVVGPNDELIGYIGDNMPVSEEAEWPNEPGVNGYPQRTSRLVEGLFNSPHGITADNDGNIYVTEWLIGGRYTKLALIE